MRNLPIRHVSLLALASLLPAPGGTVFAAANRPAVAAPPVAIVELFTSEGCSSCPPADALLRQVNLKNAASGQLVVGIGEHVTYWNRLGWKDAYSQEIFSDRQSEYAARLGVEGPYPADDCEWPGEVRRQ